MEMHTCVATKCGYTWYQGKLVSAGKVCNVQHSLVYRVSKD